MAINYAYFDARGKFAEPIFEEILFENKTLSEGLVTFEDDVKAETIFTEEYATAVMQAYTCGEPGATGSFDGFDTIVTPVKVMYYTEFCPDNLRFSRFKRDMAPGAWNVFSSEFEKIVIGGVYSRNISADLENKFWSNVTSGTKAAVAALSATTSQTGVGTQEKALVAATTTGLFDGIVQKMIYNNSNQAQVAGVGARVKVAGTASITAANIKEEYDKIYAAIPAVALDNSIDPVMLYVPKSHKQLINIYNNTPTNFKDAFSVSEDKTKYYFNGVEIHFVPVPENVMIAASKGRLVWATDLTSDFQYIEIDKIANNRDDWFLKSVMTLATHIQGQQYNVLYIGG